MKMNSSSTQRHADECQVKSFRPQNLSGASQLNSDTAFSQTTEIDTDFKMSKKTKKKKNRKE